MQIDTVIGQERGDTFQMFLFETEILGQFRLADVETHDYHPFAQKGKADTEIA